MNKKSRIKNEKSIFKTVDALVNYYIGLKYLRSLLSNTTSTIEVVACRYIIIHRIDELLKILKTTRRKYNKYDLLIIAELNRYIERNDINKFNIPSSEHLQILKLYNRK